MFLNDLRYAVRRLAKSPGFVNAYQLHPLPTVKDADRLVYVECQRRGRPDRIRGQRISGGYFDVFTSQSSAGGRTSSASPWCWTA